MRRLSILCAAAALASTTALSSTTHAQMRYTGAPLFSGLGGPEDFGTDCLHPNDDGSSREIDLRSAFPSGLQFFDDVHTSVYVNTNGNITFSGPLSTFTPNPFPVANRPMIAPYWADVDIRADIRPSGTCGPTGTPGTCENPEDNGVWWFLEPGRMVVTWDNTGYFACHEDRVMTFQLILTAVPSCGGGATDFDVEFRFNRCEWETGDASSGSGGFGGTEAQSGFDAGNSRDFIMLPGSREPGIAQQMCEMSNIGEAGVWRFQIRSGTVLCPDAGESCSTGMMGVCGEGITQCVGMGTECQPIVGMTDETCDSLDNDCDGSVDEGSLCGGGTAVCDRGVCVDVCFEGGCPPSQVCTEDGRCVDIGCEDVEECPPGQRCVAGECADACSGVTCPIGQSCRAGRCLDLCEGVACDPECSVCSEGECVAQCGPDLDCGPGETCMPDGACLPTSCLGVTCDAGFVCVDGRGCVDACESAQCPNGEVCELGSCESDMFSSETDGGVETMDGGTDGDAGDPGRPPGDGGTDDTDSGTTTGRRMSDGGCSCRTVGASNEPAPWGLLGLFALVAMRRRKR
ncbi:MAG: nidogen-like domain-containing protein [Myxococcota bacterium]